MHVRIFIFSSAFNFMNNKKYHYGFDNKFEFFMISFPLFKESDKEVNNKTIFYNGFGIYHDDYNKYNYNKYHGISMVFI